MTMRQKDERSVGDIEVGFSSRLGLTQHPFTRTDGPTPPVYLDVLSNYKTL